MNLPLPLPLSETTATTMPQFVILMVLPVHHGPTKSWVLWLVAKTAKREALELSQTISVNHLPISAHKKRKKNPPMPLSETTATTMPPSVMIMVLPVPLGPTPSGVLWLVAKTAKKEVIEF